MVVDRIEGGVAVVEVSRGICLDVPLDEIEGDVRDGAVVVEAGGGYVVDEVATAERMRRFDERRRALFD